VIPLGRRHKSLTHRGANSGLRLWLSYTFVTVRTVGSPGRDRLAEGATARAGAESTRSEETHRAKVKTSGANFEL
jgi:hypothetical protein